MLGLPDGGLQSVHCQNVFGANVDECFPRTHGVAGNSHTFEHAMRVAFQQATIHESTRVTLVGIANDEFALDWLLGNRGPLQPGGIASAAATAQAAVRNLLDDGSRS